VPAIRALQRVGSEAVADKAEALGIRFTGGRQAFLQAGLAGAIGTVEVRPLDLTSAYGALANQGYRVPPRMILEVQDASGKVIYKAPDPTAPRTISAQTAYLMTDILSGNTNPKQNPIWAKALEIRNGPKGEHRPIAVKTGTANDARDLATYGYVGPPADPKAPGLVVGIWMGNSDHSMPASKKPATSLTGAAPLWRAFVRDITAGKPVAAFPKPAGVVSATIDAWSGGRPGGWTHDRVKELFIDGTQPGAKHAVDPDGLLYSRACGGWRVDPLKAELGPRAWNVDVSDWTRRARSGPGTAGRLHTRTAYFWGERSWGGQLIGTCYRPAPRVVPPSDKAGKDKPPGEKPPHEKPPKPGPPGQPIPPAP
jgi:membrane peptidoglycan carboxypeptidase